MTDQMTDFFGRKNKAKIALFPQPEFLSDSRLYGIPCNVYDSSNLKVNPCEKENFSKDFSVDFDRLFPLLSGYKKWETSTCNQCLKTGTKAYNLNNYRVTFKIVEL